MRTYPSQRCSLMMPCTENPLGVTGILTYRHCVIVNGCFTTKFVVICCAAQKTDTSEDSQLAWELPYNINYRKKIIK